MTTKSELKQEFEERLMDLCESFTDEERLAESTIAKCLREHAKSYEPIRPKKPTRKQIIMSALKMSDEELDKKDPETKLAILQIRKDHLKDFLVKREKA